MTTKNKKVLALKYRPQIFEDLIGQNVIAETILNSIKFDKVPNAYLFTREKWAPQKTCQN